MATNLSDTSGYILRDNSWDNYILAEGRTVPSDAATGYATGCIFVHVDGGSATAVYVNEGSSINAMFRTLWAGTKSDATFLGGRTAFKGNVAFDSTSSIQFTRKPIFAFSADTTIACFPLDTTAIVGTAKMGRIAVALGEHGSIGYIPVYES